MRLLGRLDSSLAVGSPRPALCQDGEARARRPVDALALRIQAWPMSRVAIRYSRSQGSHADAQQLDARRVCDDRRFVPQADRNGEGDGDPTFPLVAHDYHVSLLGRLSYRSGRGNRAIRRESIAANSAVTIRRGEDGLRAGIGSASNGVSVHRGNDGISATARVANRRISSKAVGAIQGDLDIRRPTPRSLLHVSTDTANHVYPMREVRVKRTGIEATGPQDGHEPVLPRHNAAWPTISRRRDALLLIFAHGGPLLGVMSQQAPPAPSAIAVGVFLIHFTPMPSRVTLTLGVAVFPTLIPDLTPETVGGHVVRAHKFGRRHRQFANADLAAVRTTSRKRAQISQSLMVSQQGVSAFSHFQGDGDDSSLCMPTLVSGQDIRFWTARPQLRSSEIKGRSWSISLLGLQARTRQEGPIVLPNGSLDGPVPSVRRRQETILHHVAYGLVVSLFKSTVMEVNGRERRPAAFSSLRSTSSQRGVHAQRN
ncbi:hypothetical protein M0R72_12585 [Candidatus Pacearchaeota archaeon]|nr:hypothetical protein [Candidatus Pacearchaeota archaeon]